MLIVSKSVLIKSGFTGFRRRKNLYSKPDCSCGALFPRAYRHRGRLKIFKYYRLTDFNVCYNNYIRNE